MRHDGGMSHALTSSFCCLLLLLSQGALAQEAPRCDVSSHSSLFWSIETGCLEVPLDHTAPDGTKIPIYYEVSRPTQPSMGVIINFHGGPGYPRAHIPESGMLWEGMLAHYTFIYFHQRGSGWSGKVTNLKQLEGKGEYYTLDAVVEDARLLADALAPGLPVTVFGKSAGGFLSLLFALNYPERVSHVVLACTGADGDYLRHRDEVEAVFMQELDQRFPGFLRSWKRARINLATAPPPELAEPTVTTTPLGMLDEAYFDLSYSVRGQYEIVAIARETEKGSAGLLARRLRRGQVNLKGEGLESQSLLQHISCRELGHGDLHPFACMGISKAKEPYDVKPRLAELTMPVLVLSGQNDSVLPLRFQQDIVENLLAAPVTWAVFRWSGHMVFQEQPRASAEVILRFLGIEVPQMPQGTGM